MYSFLKSGLFTKVEKTKNRLKSFSCHDRGKFCNVYLCLISIDLYRYQSHAKDDETDKSPNLINSEIFLQVPSQSSS